MFLESLKHVEWGQLASKLKIKLLFFLPPPIGYAPQQPTPQHIYQQSNTEQFDSLANLNLDTLNPSDFSIPSLSEFLDNPKASFPNLSGEDLSNTGYVTAAAHAHHHMQFEPQMDGTFDPTSITD